MIVARITSQLANQMFAYASVKSIALDNGYTFKYVHEHCMASEISYSQADKKYGRDFDTIFPIPKEERMEFIDEKNYIEHEEFDYIKKYDSFYYEEAMQVQDNTFMKGHFICPKYFVHRIDEVRNWFAFPKDIEEKVSTRIIKIRKENPGKKLISVHFRVGNDYLLYGFLMDYSYWKNAAKKILEKFPDSKFLIFCDKKNSFVDKFIEEFSGELIQGSLVEDLCCMTKCDAYILSNSTFSMMGALLNVTGNPYVIRPEHYFTGPYSEQKNCFLDQWDVVNSKRNIRGKILSTLKIGSIRNKIYDYIFK